MKKIKISNFEETLYYEKLDNGFEVFLLPLKNKKTFYTSISVKYGGSNVNFYVDDKKYQMPDGIAHFLEHKMFERKDIENPFEFYLKLATDVNAFTSNDKTSYLFIGNNNYDESLKYLLNWLRGLKITDEDVKKEQGIILEEYNSKINQPSYILYKKGIENLYVKNSIRNLTLGTKESIMAITKDDIYTCYNSYYRPNNMFLVSVGNFDPDEAISIIKDNYKDFANIKEKVKDVIIKEPDEVNIEYEEIYGNVETPKVSLQYKINKKLFPKMTEYQLDYYLQMFLAIGFGLTSDFREEIFEKKLAYSFSQYLSAIKSHYAINFNITSDKYNDVLLKIKEYLKNIKITKEQFERIKKVWISGEIRIFDNVNALAENIVGDIIDYNKYYPNKIKDINNLDYDIFISVVKCLNFDYHSTVILLPNK